jgi:hypothetical protein
VVLASITCGFATALGQLLLHYTEGDMLASETFMEVASQVMMMMMFT